MYIGLVEGSRLAELLAVTVAPRGRSKALASALRSLIVDGRLLYGDRVPPERVLASALGVARSTVTAAFDQLRGEGYLMGRQGSGTFVAVPVAANGGRPDEEKGVGDPAIDLTVAALPAPPALAEAAAAAAEALVGHLASNGLQPAGLLELRTEVAQRYCERGLPTGADQILITAGALHAWDLLLRTFARPGAVVVTELPTYPGVIDAALAHRARLRALPVDEGGWHPEEIDFSRAPVLAHVTFDGQNPTGGWADASTRNRVVSAFDSSTVVVVDETMIDYPHSDQARQAITRPRPGQPTVVLVGSASKSFWAGLRIGWMRAPASVVQRVVAVRAGQDLAPAALNQLVVVELLQRHGEIFPQRRSMIVARAGVLLTALARHCPDWRIIPPRGGLAAWVDLRGGSSTQLAIEARDRGIRITPGPRFTHTGTHDGWLRLPFVLPQELLIEAVDGLADSAHSLQPARTRRHPTAATAWTA
jgi:DNA-binding transcriptional MocR family regulator